MKKAEFYYLLKGLIFAFLWIYSFMMSAQAPINIKGVVNDVKGDPLIGVSIQVQGTSSGTVTDVDGKFAINNVNPNAVLKVSYIGMQMQTVNVSGRESLTIVMKEDSELLNEVVVTGFGLS